MLQNDSLCFLVDDYETRNPFTGIAAGVCQSRPPSLDFVGAILKRKNIHILNLLENEKCLETFKSYMEEMQVKHKIAQFDEIQKSKNLDFLKDGIKQFVDQAEESKPAVHVDNLVAHNPYQSAIGVDTLVVAAMGTSK